MFEFAYAECKAHSRLGVSAALMRKYRKSHLDEDKDWSLVKSEGRQIVAYSEEGLVKVMEWLSDKKTAVRAHSPLLDDDEEYQAILDAADIRSVKRSDISTMPAGDLPAQEVMPQLKLVVEKKPKNRRILLCHIEEGDIGLYGSALAEAGVPPGLQRVRVKDSAKFVRGMVLPCEHQQLDLWDYTGRHPRWKGKI